MKKTHSRRRAAPGSRIPESRARLVLLREGERARVSEKGKVQKKGEKGERVQIERERTEKKNSLPLSLFTLPAQPLALRKLPRRHELGHERVLSADGRGRRGDDLGLAQRERGHQHRRRRGPALLGRLRRRLPVFFAEPIDGDAVDRPGAPLAQTAAAPAVGAQAGAGRRDGEGAAAAVLVAGRRRRGRRRRHCFFLTL